MPLAKEGGQVKVDSIWFQVVVKWKNLPKVPAVRLVMAETFGRLDKIVA
jgi:hypothetical protein